VVGKGDTLQAIAFDFGVSVGALQAANGIENPQFLQVGQRLVIPVDEEGEGSGSGQILPTPTPHPLQVQGLAFYETPVGSLLGLGEVANTTALTLTNVQVEATLLDAAGERILSTNSFTALDLVPPGSLSPFSVLFTTPPPEWSSHTVNVIRGQEAGVLSSAYVPLTVTEAEGRQLDPQYEVTGRVKNASTGRSAASVEVIVTTYDAAGAVTGFRRSSLSRSSGDDVGNLGPTSLGPGEEIAFSVLLTTHAGGPHDFTVSVLGRAADGINSGG
jgi:LysM repeat protein